MESKKSVKVTINKKGKEHVTVKNDLPMFMPVYAIDYSKGVGQFKYIGMANTDQLKDFKKLLKPKVEK